MTLNNFFADTTVAVTGAAGTVGSKLVERLLGMSVREVRAIDNAESELYEMSQRHRRDDRLQAFLCDVREQEHLTHMLKGIDYVFHAAALKHVELCERSPINAVSTNIVGTENVIRASYENKVRKVLFTSSDKAVNPTSVMGTSKLMGERLFTAANALQKDGNGPVFASTRFGNVAGSRGSVIPTFYRYIGTGSAIQLTDPGMTRFVMTLDQASDLVLEAMVMCRGGEIFVTKMPVLAVKDLARVMIDTIAPRFGRDPASVEIQEIGARPGEKLWEELISEEELRRTLESSKWYLVLPAFRNIYGNISYDYPEIEPEEASRVYRSSDEEMMTDEEIRQFLDEPHVLPTIL